MRAPTRTEASMRVVVLICLLTLGGCLHDAEPIDIVPALPAPTGPVAGAARVGVAIRVADRHRLETVGFATAVVAKRTLEGALVDAITQLLEAPDVLVALQAG